MEGRLFHVPLHQVDVKADVWIGSSHARTHVPLRWIASRNDSETTQAIIVTEPKSFLGKKREEKQCRKFRQAYAHVTKIVHIYFASLNFLYWFSFSLFLSLLSLFLSFSLDQKRWSQRKSPHRLQGKASFTNGLTEPPKTLNVEVLETLLPKAKVSTLSTTMGRQEPQEAAADETINMTITGTVSKAKLGKRLCSVSYTHLRAHET